MSSATLKGDFGGALRELKWLSWHDTGLMMTNLVLEDLVILDLSSIDITDEWLSTIQVYNFVTSFISLPCHLEWF